MKRNKPMAKEGTAFTTDEMAQIRAGLKLLQLSADRAKGQAEQRGNPQVAELHKQQRDKVKDLLDRI